MDLCMGINSVEKMNEIWGRNILDYRDFRFCSL